MTRFKRLLMVSALAGFGFSAWADEPKAVPALPVTPAKKADDKKAEEKKKLTEEQEAELEYKKYLEAQAKAMEEMAKLSTHKQVAEVKVLGTDKKTTLQTLSMTADGRILALVAPPRGFGAPTKNGFGEVHVFDDAGKPLDVWKVSFHAHAVNVAPDGTVYVAGDGKVAAFGKDGKMIGEPKELPHITELFKNKDELRKKAEESLKKEKEQREASIKAARTQFQEQIEKIEKIKEEERTKAQVRQLAQAKDILKAYEQMEKQESNRTVDQVIESMTGRARIINGVAASDKDIFVACGDTVGWGYSIWRFDRNLTNAKQILSGVGGCCGQMDVQCCGSDIVVAENTKHQFAKYDREGKKLGAYGKRGGSDNDPACFGSCCNPMNTRPAAGCGDIFTAESEGVVKRFSPTGAFLGVAGTVKISGGCKNVAIGVSPEGDKIVFCDQPGSKFYVLAKKNEK